VARGKFGWERDEAFDEKRIRLAESLLDLRTGLIIILAGVAFLLLVFFGRDERRGRAESARPRSKRSP
jgi:hypothetical protein